MLAGTSATAGSAWSFFQTHQELSTTRRVVSLPDLPSHADGLRIAFLTDLHHGPQTEPTTIAEAVRIAMGFRPDLVLLGGDYVQWDPEDGDGLVELLKPLQAPLGCFGVLGNHDYCAPDALTEALQSETGIQMLRNRSVIVGGSLWLGGIEDIGMGKPDPAALQPAPRGLGRVLLSHNPTGSRLFPEMPGLVLSGHTHGGQVLLPGVAPHRAPNLDNFPVLQGYVREKAPGVFVSRGVGNTALPVRFRCPPEVVLITLATTKSSTVDCQRDTRPA